MAVSICSPLDVIKSRLMNGHFVDGQKVLYRSVYHAITDLYRRGGILSFYSGMNAFFFRVVNWNIIMFMTREQIFRFVDRYRK